MVKKSCFFIENRVFPTAKINVFILTGNIQGFSWKSEKYENEARKQRKVIIYSEKIVFFS